MALSRIGGISRGSGGHFLSLERSKGPSGFKVQIFKLQPAGQLTPLELLAWLTNGIEPIKKKSCWT